MRRPFDTKRFWLIVALVALIEILVIWLALRWKYIFPTHEVSETYRHYQNVEGVDVTFIKDYKVNDTVAIDVTLLEARDSAGWETLKHDFAVTDLNAELQQFTDDGKDLIFSRKIAKNGQPLNAHDDTSNYDMLATSHYAHTLTIFHITNNDEKHAVYCHNFDESINLNK